MVQSFSPDFTVGILKSFLRGVRLFPGGVRLSGCLQFTCLPARQFICLPVWLVVSQKAYYWGSQFSLKRFPPVCRCWCPRLRMSFFTKKVSRHLSPSLAGGVRLFGSLSSLPSLDLSPSGVRLSGCPFLLGLQLCGCLSVLVSLHLSPDVPL